MIQNRKLRRKLKANLDYQKLNNSGYEDITCHIVHLTPEEKARLTCSGNIPHYSGPPACDIVKLTEEQRVGLRAPGNCNIPSVYPEEFYEPTLFDNIISKLKELYVYFTRL